MKPILITALLAIVTVSSLAQNADEEQAIAVLQSNASLQEKDAACLKLRLTATPKAVPALAALLTDEQLSHSARLVLERMSNPEAGRALVDALDKTSNLTRIGIIDSLGIRAEKSAVQSITKLLADSDAATVAAAADALGSIGGSDANKALENAPLAAHPATINALLACANRELDGGNKSGVLEILNRLDDLKEKDFVRTAAFRGIILASGDKSLSLVADAIQGADRAKQIAALQLVRELDDPATTKTICDLLPKVPPAIQTSLIESLAQRGDASAAHAILPLASSEVSSVRLAVINALGILGDASAVESLAAAAASLDPATQKTARQALLRLNRGDVTAALLAKLPGASSSVAAEIARAIGARAEGEPLSALVKILELSKNDATINATRDAILYACQHAQSSHRGLDVDLLIAAMKSANQPAREAVLQILSRLADPKVRDALRAAGASRAICESRDPELLPDIIALAKSGDETIGVLAIRGGVRLAAERQRPQQIETLKALLAAATRDEDRRLVIGGLANVPCDETLAIVKSLVNSPGVEAEAKQAVEQITSAMTARKLNDGYILDWQVAGLFREIGKDYHALFDTVFLPEKPDAKAVAWRALPSGTNAEKPWLLDLLKALGDEHQCVAYVRTRIHSDSSQPVRLEIGSDDGVKVWLNGAQVYANNTARPVTPGSDKVDVTLKPGWNSLMLKITQNIMGWEFCVRIVGADGNVPAGLGVDAAGE